VGVFLLLCVGFVVPAVVSARLKASADSLINMFWWERALGDKKY
jgi:hypothetical protein